MANWTGTYAITTPGTTPTSVDATHLNNTGASWPTSPSLAGWTVRILTGPGAGTNTLIVSNTATAITVSAWTGTQPTTGSTYELVSILANGDVVTGTLSFGTNCITEIANNAVVTVSANVAVTFASGATVRWVKTETTYATIQWYQRTNAARGKWVGLNANGATLTNSGCGIKYIKITDAVTGLTIPPTVATGTGSVIGPLWVENCSSVIITTASAALDQNKLWSGIYANSCHAANITWSSVANAFTEIYEKVWIENSFTSAMAYSSNATTIQIIRDSVLKCHTNSLFDNVGGTGKYIINQDNYISRGPAGDGNSIVVGNSSGTATSNYWCVRNVLNSSRNVYGAGTGSVGIMKSAFNDWVLSEFSAFQGIAIANSTSYGTSTSDNDYLSGTNDANLQCIDTSASTSSTAVPTQYSVLTASRSNPKSVRNRPLVCDNVSVGTPTSNSVTVTFDCQNGVVAGQGSSTVTTDSNSGQTVLSTTNTTGFDVYELIEIGKGTARYEIARIVSISANTSLTLDRNLTYTHTSAQADTITKQLRHYGLPFIRYGTSSGSYDMETQIPDRSVHGLIFSGWKTTYNGQTVAFNRAGHSVTLNNLKPGTTYYIQCCAYNPLGELLVSNETSFSTAAAPSGGSYTFIG